MESLKKKKRLLDSDQTQTSEIHKSLSVDPQNTGGKNSKQPDNTPSQITPNPKPPKSKAMHGGGNGYVSLPYCGMTFAEDRAMMMNKEYFDGFYMIVKGFDH